METEIYSKTIVRDNFKEIRLTISEFNGIEYLHVREYYLDFDEVWKPSPKGVSMPLEIESSKEFFAGICEILSLAESKEIIEKFFGELIIRSYQN